MAWVYGISSDSDARVDTLASGEGGRAVVNGDLFHVLEPALLLPLAGDTLEGGEACKSTKDFGQAIAFFRQALALSRFIPFAADEANEACEREASFIASGEDSGKDGERRMSGDEGSRGDRLSENKWGKSDELDGRNGGRDCTSEDLTCASRTSKQGIVNDRAS